MVVVVLDVVAGVGPVVGLDDGARNSTEFKDELEDDELESARRNARVKSIGGGT